MKYTTYRYFILVSHTALTKIQENSDEKIEKDNLINESDTEPSTDEQDSLLDSDILSNDDSTIHGDQKSDDISTDSDTVIQSDDENDNVENFTLTDLFHEVYNQANIDKLTSAMKSTYPDLKDVKVLSIQSEKDDVDDYDNLQGQTLIEISISKEYTGGYLDHLVFMLGYHARYNKEVNQFRTHSDKYGDYLVEFFTKTSDERLLGNAAD